MTKIENQIWVTRILVATIIVMALFWGLTAEIAHEQQKEIWYLQSQLSVNKTLLK